MFRANPLWRRLYAVALLIFVTNQRVVAQDMPLPEVSPTVSESSRLPITTPSSAAYSSYDSYRAVAQQQIRDRVQFEARQRVLRAEWNQWIGYSPNRPTLNSSIMSNSLQYYYLPSRGMIVNNGMARTWYW